jgi:hypothetical protein
LSIRAERVIIPRGLNWYNKPITPHSTLNNSD